MEISSTAVSLTLAATPIATHEIIRQMAGADPVHDFPIVMWSGDEGRWIETNVGAYSHHSDDSYLEAFARAGIAALSLAGHYPRTLPAAERIEH